MTKVKGFACPECNKPTKVVKTRARASGIIARRRECPRCGYKVTTEERPKQGPHMAPVH